MNKIYKILFFLSIITLSAFLLSGCTTSEEKISEYNQIIEEADILIGGREYNLAIEKLSKASELIPSKVEAIERIVDVFIVKNRLEDATKVIDESGVKLKDQDRANLYVKVGDAHYESKKYDRALYNYQLAKGMDSSNEKASLGIAKVYMQNGNIENARSLLKENYEGDVYIEAQLLLSYLTSLSKIEDAKNILKDVEPGDKWRFMYTSWEDTLNDLTDDELFNSAKQSKIYLDRGYPYLVIALLEPQKTKMIEYTDGIYLLGKAYYEKGEYQKSIDLLENSTSISDLNQYIYWLLARNYYLLDNINSSFSYYDSAISYGGDKATDELYIEYLDLLFESNQTEKALELMRKAERIFDKPWVKLYFMNLYVLRKDDERFEYHMEKVEYETLDSDLKAEYLSLKGKYLIQKKDFEETKRTLDIFWELDKFDPRYNLLYAQLSFQEGNLDDARVYSKKAIEYDTERLVTEDAQKLLAQID